MRKEFYDALIVDADRTVRGLTAKALVAEGFRVQTADDGLDAETMAFARRYDLVVTELRLPGKNGHALSVLLLGMTEPPVIMMLTAVGEPRLTKDLLARGVDDVELKPVEFDVFAAKARALVRRRRSQPQQSDIRTGLCETTSEPSSSSRETEMMESPLRITLHDIETKLRLASRMLPLSPTAMNVHQLCQSTTADAQEIASVAKSDTSLASLLLCLANSTFYNPGGHEIVELESAITRIGQKRVGEAALATNALTALTAQALPWMDVGLVWRRSVAAGVAIELLLEQTEHCNYDCGLLLCAIMHPLGVLFWEQCIQQITPA